MSRRELCALILRVLYHDASGQLVGIAGKPGSVNDFNVRSGDGKVNTKLAGIRELPPILLHAHTA